jgi:hypothetical protein
MATADSGLKDLSWGAKDSAVAVADGALDDQSSPLVDLLDGTSGLLPDALMFGFAIGSSGAGGYDMSVFAVFSEDNVDTVPTGVAENKKIQITNLRDTTASATLAKSNLSSIPVLGRYFKLAYQNNGPGNSITITSRYAPSFQQSFQA